MFHINNQGPAIKPRRRVDRIRAAGRMRPPRNAAAGCRGQTHVKKKLDVEFAVVLLGC
jgi:hypothetical protein